MCRELSTKPSECLNDRVRDKSEPQTALNRATVGDCLGEVAVTAQPVFNEPAIHELAIYEPTVSKTGTRKCTVREVAIDEVAVGKEAPVPVDFLERTANKI